MGQICHPAPRYDESRVYESQAVVRQIINTCALGQWIALNRYVDHGILSIDNNLAERVLRMVVIG
ncbi:transposase [Planctomycetota bacterium]